LPSIILTHLQCVPRLAEQGIRRDEPSRGSTKQLDFLAAHDVVAARSLGR
jgi:hypothetical protein